MLEIKYNGILSLVYNDILDVSQGDHDVIDYEGQFVDDMSGRPLRKELVFAARKDEMATYFSHHAKLPISECW